MSEFKTIETQKELDRIISERLARQKNRFMDYDQLKDRVEELETENL
ncbi:phage scaffold protein, partial [Streptococcus danieliae]|nr:phage scaffold protein [Streptococcus danieliae]